MGKWSERVAEALRDSTVRDGIATLVARYSKEHIETSKGRGDTGNLKPLAPLSAVEGEYWTTKRPRDMSAVKQTRKRVVSKQVRRAKGRIVTVKQEITEYLLSGQSYRNGGKPLRDTGEMMREMGAKADSMGKDLQIVLYGPLHAIFHEMGFETDGPNFIPMTKKGKREHATGRNPASEGLVQGKDYIMAWKGVTVPARPFMVPTNDEWVEIGKSIRMGLARILKGRYGNEHLR